MKLSKNFDLSELIKSDTATKFNIDNRPNQMVIDNLLFLTKNILQPLRDDIGKPIIILSGYRSPILNKKVHGVKDSFHIQGLAADIMVNGWSFEKLGNKLNYYVSYDQLIMEGTWLHVSISKIKNRKQMMTMKNDQYRIVHKF